MTLHFFRSLTNTHILNILLYFHTFTEFMTIICVLYQIDVIFYSTKKRAASENFSHLWTYNETQTHNVCSNFIDYVWTLHFLFTSFPVAPLSHVHVCASIMHSFFYILLRIYKYYYTLVHVKLICTMHIAHGSVDFTSITSKKVLKAFSRSHLNSCLFIWKCN